MIRSVIHVMETALFVLPVTMDTQSMVENVLVGRKKFKLEWHLGLSPQLE